LKRLGKFTFLFLVGNLLGWFAIEGLIFIELLMKPYTEVGEVILRWGQHILIFVGVTILAWGLSDDKSNRGGK
jgi:hypothetical protein